MTTTLPTIISRLGCSLLLLTAASAQAAVNFQLAVESHSTVMRATGTPPAPDSRQTYNVTLAESYIALANGSHTTIYDFKTRRRLELDTAHKTYSDFSLYAPVALRSQLLESRIKQHMALASIYAAGALARVDDEHDLSIATPDPSPLTEDEAGDLLIFGSEAHELARWSLQGQTESTADMRRFAELVRYLGGGHPRILSELVKRHRLPAQLQFTFQEEWGVHVLGFAVSGIQQLAAPSYQLTGYRQQQPDDPLQAVLAGAARLSPASVTAWLALDQQAMTILASHGHGLQAMLMSLRGALGNGSPRLQLPPAATARLEADTAVQQFLTSLEANTPNSYAEAAQTLLALRPQAGPLDYVLEVYEADTRVSAQDYAGAEPLYFDALRRQPALAGVYYDLGNFYYRQYDSERAWRCWDAGRRLAPQYSGYVALDSFEQALATQYPDFF